jgi:histidyl-tRNA synthetase
MRLAESLRESAPHLRVQFNLGGGNFRAQFKRADKSGAAYAIVLGDDELARGVVALKDLRRSEAQEECPLERICERLGSLLGRRTRD